MNKDRATEQVTEMMDRLDKLSLQKHDMSVNEAQDILDDFARVLIFLSESSCYPSPYKPISLLPRKKEKIETAMAVAMAYADNDDKRQPLYLGYCELIDAFRDDKEAEEMNNRVLSILSKPKVVIPDINKP